MFYSKYCEYTVRALSYLSTQSQNDKYVMVKDISEKTGIPYHFLSKIFQDLANTDWVISKKGKNGGFTMSVKAEDLKLIEVIKWSDGLQKFNLCVLGGNKECGRDYRCNTHNKCSQLRNEITTFYETMSIKDVAEMETQNITEK
jgi:Rrf2 family transcriptional regulator, iron-sulfur cluster assembly transcription factor